MGLVVITAAATEPVTLTEVKAHCRIDGTDHDTILAIYIKAARQKCEGILSRPVLTTTLQQSLDAFPTEEIALKAAPVQSITHIKYTDTNGDEQTLDSGLYTLDATNPTCWVLPAYGTDWPDTEDSANAVRVRFVAGWASADTDVPADVKAWILLTVGYLFAQREALDSTGRVSEIPGRFVDSLLDPYRYYGP